MYYIEIYITDALLIITFVLLFESSPFKILFQSRIAYREK